MKRLFWLILGILPIIAFLSATAQDAGNGQFDQTTAHAKKHRRHKNHHKGHIKRDPYPQ
ncbi:MAG: hypothetical protein ACXVZV_06275 [Terriglobales bacterium]